MKSLRLLGCVFVLATAGAAQAQPAPALNEQAQNMIGTWEFSNADRDKTCSVTFKSDATSGGYKVEFDANCTASFPVVREVTAWKYPQNDLLYMLDAQGRAVISFSEVEDGMFEAPTPGIGVLLLQNPAAAPPPAKTADQVAGKWSLKSGDGAVLCELTLTSTATKEALAATVEPGCDASIIRQNFTQWRMDREELVLVPGRGAPWRFESLDDTTWGRLPESENRMTLVRQ